MASPAQITANRLNAMKSTGPRTCAGKAASRLNALRHGADAELSIIPGEDPAEFEALVCDYRNEYRPSSAEERFLVDTLVHSEWLRRRLRRIETEMTNHLLAEMEPCDHPLGVLYCSDTPGARALERIRRHNEAADRAWFRALRRLERLRRESADALLFDIAPPVPAPEPPAAGENWLRSENSIPALHAAPDDRVRSENSSPSPRVPPAPPARDPHLALRL